MHKWVQILKSRANALKTELYALYLAYRDPRTPWYARLFSALVVGYAFSPIDLIPDFVPLLGYLDDLIILPLGVAISLRLIPPEVMVDCRLRAKEILAQGKPVNWVAGAVIISIWVIILALIGIGFYRLVK